MIYVRYGDRDSNLTILLLCAICGSKGDCLLLKIILHLEVDLCIVSEDRYGVTWNNQHTKQVVIGPKCVDRLQVKISAAEMEHHFGNIDLSPCLVTQAKCPIRILHRISSDGFFHYSLQVVIKSGFEERECCAGIDYDIPLAGTCLGGLASDANTFKSKEVEGWRVFCYQWS